MSPKNTADIDQFIAAWTASGAAERKNKDLFLTQLCLVLGVPPPDPAHGDPARDTYVFEYDVPMQKEDGTSIGRIDLYKAGCFVLEAKQGAEVVAEGHKPAAKVGHGRRESQAWFRTMNDAYGQAVGYARSLPEPPPFVVVCDIGFCFELYAAFDGTTRYRPFPYAGQNRLYVKDLRHHVATLRALFLDPHGLDPSRHAAKVTRTVAADIAELARSLEDGGIGQERVARFLMRCVFTMFAEDIGLLPDGLFLGELRDHWIPNPTAFPSLVEQLWRQMNEGGFASTGATLLRFNGGLFANPEGLRLTRAELELLRRAAERDWTDVEPSIFGTLLERALTPSERHMLGAHYTPRAYVERLVRPTIEQPLRDEWELVRAAVHQLRNDDRPAAIEEARELVEGFHDRLRSVRVLDPACGTGNFLYVTLDLFKRLEDEVLRLLEDLGEAQTVLELHHHTVIVSPEQLLGIEVKPWAREIADLVLWIGYLQWHYRTWGRKTNPPEPVLRNYGNIQLRDAILAYDKEELVKEHGKPVTRWDGRTMKRHPVTGEEVPDETARVPLRRYVNPRPAEWPEAEFIIGNPPYIGNKRMRLVLGDGYVEALRKAHPDVPETSDLVMYWWNHAAKLVRGGKARRFGLITTNSITQTFNRKVVQTHLEASDRASVVFAIPDHPWVDSTTGAAVRIAMTMVDKGEHAGSLSRVVKEERTPGQDDIAVELEDQNGWIHPDLSVGPDIHGAMPLKANADMSLQGIIPLGKGFRLTPDDLKRLGLSARRLPRQVRRFLIGRDIVQQGETRYLIDFFGLTEDKARQQAPALYQHLLLNVKPERDQNRRSVRRNNWWLFGENAPKLRRAVAALRRYIVTVETSKHKPFVFVDGDVLPDHKLYAIASEDAYHLGVLSSRAHLTWALAAGGRLGVGNDPTWTNTTCFLPFPFPAASDAHQRRIRDLGERLDAHRKQQQAAHPELTITAMYNVLAKLRVGEPLGDKDKVVHEQGLVSVLRQIHDALDAAVFDAYGWPPDLTDEQILEKLVALNAERVDEERRGVIRWLRPEYQKPAAATQVAIAAAASAESAEQESIAAAVRAPWPKKLPDRIAAVRDLVRRERGPFTVSNVATAFQRARRAEVEAILDSLAALGHVVRYEADGERRWRRAT